MKEQKSPHAACGGTQKGEGLYREPPHPGLLPLVGEKETHFQKSHHPLPFVRGGIGRGRKLGSITKPSTSPCPSLRRRGEKRNASTIIFAAIFVTLFTLATGSYMTVISSASVGTARIAEQQKAFYAAEAGANRLLSELNTTGFTSVWGRLGRTRTSRASYTATYRGDTITSTGTVGSMRRTITVRVQSIPPAVRAAVTVNGRIYTRGRITLDGRTYDENGSVVSENGIYGVSSANRVRQRGRSQIGGNGYAPDRRANPKSYNEYAGSFSSTQPWDLLGVSQAWFNLNVPLRRGLPPPGFNGIWYTDGPRSWRGRLDNVSGILIVHNAGGTAGLWNIRGTFKGLIIADRIYNVARNAKIYGALISTRTRSGTLRGGRNSLIAYSPQILTGLQTLVEGQTRLWKKVISAGTWQE